VFFRFNGSADLERKAAASDVVVATHFRSVALLSALFANGGDKLPAYYIQDYEPFFADAGSADAVAAFASYAAIPDQVCFAKTRWLCDLVGSVHGVHVSKVEPSLDHEVYYPPREPRIENRAVRVLGMIRPRTARRQPVATAALLERLAAELGQYVEVAAFGCDDRELSRVAPRGGSSLRNLGVLTRDGVATALRESDIFVDCSFYQAFGRTALEAMACGCTCVVPSVGGATEFARHGENAIVVDSTDRDGVFEAIRGLVHDRSDLARLQSSAIQAARKFSLPLAALSEYMLFEREYLNRFGPRRRAGAGLREQGAYDPL
jgi:glycosyltransferase involved in cell wall biosynthesis